jgi:hypothetical protein
VTEACPAHDYPRGTISGGRLLLPLAAVTVIGFVAMVVVAEWLGHPSRTARTDPDLVST